MAVLVRTCCCGCDLKTGILLIAIFGLLSSAFGIYAGIYNAKVRSDAAREGKLTMSNKYDKVVVQLDYASVALSVLMLLTNVLLLGSYGTRNRFLALPYIILHIFLLAFNLGMMIFVIAIWYLFSYLLVGYILVWLLWIYFIIVVFSYHEALREDPSGSSAGFVPLAPPTAPMVQMQVVGGPPPYPKYP